MNSLKVTYNNQFAGVCDFNSENGKTFFQYSPDFLKSGIELSPLLLPLENRIFEFTGLVPIGKWKLAPAYDLTFAYNPDSFWLRNHNISINGKSSDIAQEDILAVGEKFGIKRCGNIFSDVNEVVQNFKYYAEKWGY
ncbi:hypothetical protein R83H12_01088 [Fibrobacteria bacterium R8-3-H12]